jgi:hypothetical protein
MKKILIAIVIGSLLYPGGNALEALPVTCSAQKIIEILAPASSAVSTVNVDCHLNLKSSHIVTKRMIFEGAASSGVNVDCNYARLNGGEGAVNYNKDMIEVRSGKFMDAETGTWKWERPENITIKKCDITGSVRVWGVAINGQGVDLRDSSRLSGHVVRARKNAPAKIILDNVTITGVGRIPLYLSPGVTYSGIVNSEIKGRSVSAAIYFDAESYGNIVKNNYIHAATRREVIAIDGSGFNEIDNNIFAGLNNGGIYLYRNCGEGGTIRHSTPEGNTIADNVFYYKRYAGDKPAVYLGARNGKSSYCDADSGYPFGSSASDMDYAKYNTVKRNRIYERTVSDMIRTGNPAVNSPNYVSDNLTVQ